MHTYQLVYILLLNPVYKCTHMIDGSPVLVFRPLTLSFTP